jgi:WD40 repeat protein
VQIHLWDLPPQGPLPNKPRLVLDHGDSVLHLTFSPDGKLLASGGENDLALIWDVATGRQTTPAMRHYSDVYQMSFDTDGRLLATGSDDNMARVWNVQTGECLMPRLTFNGSVHVVRFGQPSGQLLTASDDNTVCIWELPDHRLMRSARRLERRPVTTEPPRPDGMVLPADHLREDRLGKDGTLELVRVDANAFQVVEKASRRPISPPLRQQGYVTHAAFSPDGSRVVTCGFDQTARVWDSRTGKECCPPLRHASIVEYATFSPDGTLVLTAGSDNTARIWNAADGSSPHAPLQHRGTVWHACFHHDGKLLVTASSDHTARVWDARTSEPVSPPLRHPRIALQARFVDNPPRVITVDGDWVERAWDLPRSDLDADLLRRLAEVLAGSRIHGTIARPIDSRTLHRQYLELVERLPELFGSSPHSPSDSQGHRGLAAPLPNQADAVWVLPRPQKN